jgi:hypothetical protein
VIGSTLHKKGLRSVVSLISRKTSEIPRISCTLSSDRTACAPFFKERRMKFGEATELHRKSGIWGTRVWWKVQNF